MTSLNSSIGFSHLVLGLSICVSASSPQAILFGGSIQNVAQSALPEHVSLIKPDKSDGPSQMKTGNLRFSATNVDIASLISEGYGIPLAMIANVPNWSKQFDLQIKVVHDEDAKRMTASSRRDLLRAVLEERFHIVTHLKTELGTVYFLRPSPKLRGPARHLKLAASGEQVSFSSSDTGIRAGSLPISVLCTHLTEILHKSVIDESGLPGRYDFESSWLPNSVDDTSSRQETRSLKEALREDLGLGTC